MKTYTVQVGDVTRELPLMEVPGGARVALFNMLGDTEVTEAAGKALAARLPGDVDMLVTPEVKAVSLAHVISRESGKPYIVIRKTQKPYMHDPIAREVVSITTGKPQLLVLDGFDVHVPKPYIYAAMGFSALVEVLNVLMRRRAKAHQVPGAGNW